MDYNHIKDYLEKFKNILFLKEEKNKTIIAIIKKNTGIEIGENFIKTQGGVIQIKASPIVKGEILIHKESILKDLSSVAGFVFKDIK